MNTQMEYKFNSDTPIDKQLLVMRKYEKQLKDLSYAGHFTYMLQETSERDHYINCTMYLRNDKATCSLTFQWIPDSKELYFIDYEILKEFIKMTWTGEFYNHPIYPVIGYLHSYTAKFPTLENVIQFMYMFQTIIDSQVNK